jgi:segregation and condensation protein B
MMHDDTAGDTAGEAQPGPGLRACLEAILLVVDEPVAEVVLAQVLERPREEIALEIRELAASYDAEGRGFDLREVAGGWRFYTREECAPVVERFVRDGQEVRLTQAALETLAVVAYRQPVSRARVSAVRGVNCDGVMRTLTLRGLVEEAGTEHETGSILYRTTGYFLERLGLASLGELPELAPFLPDDLEDADGSEAGADDVEAAQDAAAAEHAGAAEHAAAAGVPAAQGAEDIEDAGDVGDERTGP